MQQDSDETVGVNLTEELSNQKQKVVARLMQNISMLGSNIELDYLKNKWVNNPDGSKLLIPQELTVQACIKLHQQNYRFDDIVDKLKFQEVESQALITRKLKMLEETI